MQIILNPKYNIGDTVYTCGHYHELYPISQPYTVVNILVNGDIHRARLTYMIERDGLTDKVPEDWLFKSYAECTKWCEKQNKSL